MGMWGLGPSRHKQINFFFFFEFRANVMINSCTIFIFVSNFADFFFTLSVNGDSA